MKFQMAFLAPFFLWVFPFDVFCFLWPPCSCKISFWDFVFCSYITYLAFEISRFLAVARFPYETSCFVSHTRFHGITLCRKFSHEIYSFCLHTFFWWGFLMRRVHAFCYMICWWERHAFESLRDFLMRCHAFELEWDLLRRVHAVCCIIWLWDFLPMRFHAFLRGIIIICCFMIFGC